MTTMVDVIVGGQYGSEAKGHVTAQLVKAAVRDGLRPELSDMGIEVWNVRVAGPNAGHTAYDEHGTPFAFRSLPVGAVVDHSVKLYIAPGSEVDLEVLYGEIAVAEAAGHPVRGRLWMSRQATLLEAHHKETERDAELVARVGSTGKGIGAARAERIMRVARTVGDAFEFGPDKDGDAQPWQWAEPEELYATDDFAHNKNQHLFIEGTQGYGLSLRASGHYPQTTSSDARAVDFLAMAGIDPTRCSVKITNWVVARVHPIRVAGNSGTMKGETSWDELGLEAERTTVTQKIRRVGEWDPELLARAVQANGGHAAKVVITMLDQVIPELQGLTADELEPEEDSEQVVHPALEKALEWVNEHAPYDVVGAHVAGITFSPTQMLFTNHAFDGGQGGPVPEAVLEAAVQQAMGEIFGIGQAEQAEESGR
jgi:adenylosuccinate synthase